MRIQRRTFQWSFVVGLLFATVACGGVTQEPVEGDARDASFVTTGKSDDLAPEENSAEARAILEVANTFSLHGLVRDVDLYWNGASHLIDHRNGPDGIRNSDDDRYFRSMKELDEVPYIGPVSMRRFRTYVHEEGLIADHTIEYTDTIPARMNTARDIAFRGTLKTRQLIRIPIDARAGDRVLMWLRKAGDEQWNPKIEIVDADTEETITWSNPWGFTDARLPDSAEEASRGFEIDREPANYTVILDNTGDVDGEFEFTMECVGGPCFDIRRGPVLDGDFGDLEDDELRAQMVARHEMTHIYLDYYEARKVMFEDLDNEDGKVECVYTGEVVETETIPSNLEMNAEHTWPQSQGAIDGAARSDLHHVFPVTSVANSIRSAYPYCEVEVVAREVGGSLYGQNDGEYCFEPRDEHKGAAARAMLYFAAVYQQEIDDDEEATLRAWAEEFEITEDERARNDAIEEIQGSRNFFIDDPSLIDRISDF
jgi:endonuclease I